jgi:transmembrane sensor
MKLDRRDGGKVAEEAAFWVVTLTESPGWSTRTKFRAWARQSTRHSSEFLVAASIYRELQGFDVQRSIDVQALIDEANRAVVPLKTVYTCPATPGRCDPPVPGTMQTSRKLRTLLRPRRVAYAAGRALVATLLLTFILPLTEQRQQFASHDEYLTGTGEQRIVPLDAGSRVTLSERSNLTITRTPHAYTVQLRGGEARFSVRHDPNRRIWVLLGDTVVEDVGTVFTVRRSAANSSVSVLEGSVRIETAPLHSFLVADAGQELWIHGSQLQLLRTALAKSDSSLKQSQDWLTFNGQPLAEVVRTFNRRNHRQLVLADPSIAQLPVGGRFLTTDFTALVAALTSALPVRVQRNRAASDDDGVVRLVRVDTAAPDDSFVQLPEP